MLCTPPGRHSPDSGEECRLQGRQTHKSRLLWREWDLGGLQSTSVHSLNLNHISVRHKLLLIYIICTVIKLKSKSTIKLSNFKNKCPNVKYNKCKGPFTSKVYPLRYYVSLLNRCHDGPAWNVWTIYTHHHLSLGWLGQWPVSWPQTGLTTWALGRHWGNWEGEVVSLLKIFFLLILFMAAWNTLTFQSVMRLK